MAQVLYVIRKLPPGPKYKTWGVYEKIVYDDNFSRLRDLLGQFEKFNEAKEYVDKLYEEAEK